MRQELFSGFSSDPLPVGPGLGRCLVTELNEALKLFSSRPVLIQRNAGSVYGPGHLAPRCAEAGVDGVMKHNHPNLARIGKLIKAHCWLVFFKI